MSTATKIVPPVAGTKPFAPVHEVENIMAFNQEKIIKAGPTEILGTLDTSRFDKIRVVAMNEASTCDAHFCFRILEQEGAFVERNAILDEFTLKPNNQLTRVYDVPATKLEISVAGVVKPFLPIKGKPDTQAEVVVLIFGQY